MVATETWVSLIPAILCMSVVMSVPGNAMAKIIRTAARIELALEPLLSLVAVVATAVLTPCKGLSRGALSDRSGVKETAFSGVFAPVDAAIAQADQAKYKEFTPRIPTGRQDPLQRTHTTSADKWLGACVWSSVTRAE